VTKIKYNADLMKIIPLFEGITGAKLKDCILNERLVFIVEENEMGKAIGKKGSNIKRLENMLKKKIRVVGFNQDVLQFIKNLLYPLQIASIENNDGTIAIKADTKTKALVIGRNKQNLNNLVAIVKRYFDISDIRVV
jgi:N utilization substance protein A